MRGLVDAIMGFKIARGRVRGYLEIKRKPEEKQRSERNSLMFQIASNCEVPESFP